MTAMWRAAVFAVRRRKLQTSIIGLVLMLSTATVVLALGLLATVDGPYDQAFARQRGAHLTVSYDAAKTTAAQVAATASRPGVTAAGGPYQSEIVTVRPDGDAGGPGPFPPMPLVVVARTPRAGDAVDRLTLTSGRWAARPGEIVLSSDYASGPVGDVAGRRITFTDGRAFTVVGTARSITRSAQGWVLPGQLAHPSDLQVLYRLADRRTPAATIAAGLPMTGSQSYLVVRSDITESTKTTIPFLVAFGVAGLIVAILIIGNVVSGAVVSGFRHIGALKAIGFTPAQVTGVYLGMILMPGILGSLIGIAAGNTLAGMLSAALSESFDLPAASGISVWVDVLALAGVLTVIAGTALVPAVRAGRIPAAIAVSAGSAPRRGRALRVQRMLARTRLPRPVSLGLGLPFARPGRTALTVSAITFGVAAVTFAIGLDRTVDAYFADKQRVGEYQVQVFDVHAAQRGPDARGAAALARRPGTVKVAITRFAQVHVPGLSRSIDVQAYQGAATDRHGYRIAEGRWLAGPGELVAAARFLKQSGKKVGDVVSVGKDGRKATLKIVGVAVIDNPITDWATLTAIAPMTEAPRGEGPKTGAVAVNDATIAEITLAKGVSAGAYVAALRADGMDARTADESEANTRRTILLGLVAILTLGIAAVAGLGVFNTVVLNTRDRARDFGILKSLGATPRQVLMVVLASMAALGLLGGLLGLPLGIATHSVVMPLMADAGGVVLPYSVTDVFPWLAIVLFVLAGVAIAVLGALIPAGWASRIRTATALRSE